MKKAYVDLPEGQAHYRTEGSGIPIIMLHQTPFSSDDFTEVIQRLSGSFRAIALDTMGYGMSDRPGRPFQMEDYARTVRAFIQVLGLEKATVVGHHTGAMIGVELAAAYPDSVERLILSGTPYDEPAAWEALRPRLTINMEPDADGAYLMDAWKKLSRHKDVVGAGPAVWHRGLVSMLMAWPGADDARRAVFDYDIGARLPLLKCPVLLLSGTHDTFVHRVNATQKMIPGSVVRMIEGGGPSLPLDMPAEFAQAIIDFMGSSAGDGRGH